MTTMTSTLNKTVSRDEFLVIHPMFDVQEEKFDTNKIDKMKMTKSVKISLMCLRAYLIVMILLAGYRTLSMAGLF